MKKNAGITYPAPTALAVLCVLLALAGCKARVAEDDERFSTTMNPGGGLGIACSPTPVTFATYFGPGSPIPAYDDGLEDPFQVDLRGSNLAELDLSGRARDLAHASFDSQTRWPASLPEGFDPEAIMALGKDPGLGVKSLHERGVTGTGVGVAIIDQRLLVDHVEYADRLRLYEEIHYRKSKNGAEAAMHGPAVASVAVGRKVGVAPEADLYFIAETCKSYRDGNYVSDMTPIAEAVERICAVNDGLPEGKKIRVISISLGIKPESGNSDRFYKAVKKAEKRNIYVVYVGSDDFGGAYRSPLDDPDKASSYGPGSFWARIYRDTPPLEVYGDAPLFPMDSRCLASPTGSGDYVFYNGGGMSWVVPYVAGLYALACQVYPEVDRKLFWRTAEETSDVVAVTGNSRGITSIRMANPVRLIEKLERLGSASGGS